MEKVIEINNLSKSFGKQIVLDNISLNINQGEIVGIVGANGVGKTTMMKILSGLIKEYEGEIFFDNKNIKSSFEKYIEKVGVMIETPTFYSFMSGRDNLKYVRYIYNEKENQIEQQFEELFGVKQFINKKVSKYSLGMKQKLAICRSFIGSPKLMILDEPTNGLDINSTIAFREKLRKVVKENGISVLISSHDLGEIEELCDRIYFMFDGKINEISKSDQNKNGNRYKIEFENNEKALEMLKGQQGVEVISCEDRYVEIIDMNKKGMLISKLIESGIVIYSWSEIADTLKDIYLNQLEESRDV